MQKPNTLVSLPIKKFNIISIGHHQFETFKY